MTGKETYQLWRNLSFWPRLAVECGLCIVVAFLVDYCSLVSSSIWRLLLLVVR